MAITVHHTDMAAVSVGGFVGIGKLLYELGLAQGWLASLSYMAAITVAIVTIYFKVKDRNKGK